MCTYCTHAYQRFPEVLNTFQNMWPDTCISWSFTRKLLFNHLHLSVLPGAVVVLRGISGRCERVRAGNISPAFWGCQGLDKSCLNFSLCKMPCVNSCPWPKHSDLVRQTTGVAHPSPCGLGWQSAWLRFCNQSGLKYSRMSKTSCHFSTRNRYWKQPEGEFRWFSDSSPSCSLLPCLGQLALVAESLRQVLCRSWVVEATSASTTSAALLVTPKSVRILHGCRGRSF